MLEAFVELTRNDPIIIINTTVTGRSTKPFYSLPCLGHPGELIPEVNIHFNHQHCVLSWDTRCGPEQISQAINLFNGRLEAH